MERTEELLRAVMVLLPPPPESTIEFDAGGAEDDGGGVAGGLSGGVAPEGGGVVPEGGGGASGGLDAGAAAGGPDGGAAGKEAGGLGSGTTDEGAAEGAIAGEETKDGAGDDGTHTHSTGAPKFYLQSSDLYLYGRPLSNVWENVWKEHPLILHDKELLDASRKIQEGEGVALPKNTAPNFTLKIANILNNHPGPMSLLRLDSSAWSWEDDQLGLLMEKASTKAVEKLIIINSLLPTNISFPISALQSPNLTHLSLGFMRIRGMAVGAFNYSRLRELCIFGCTYNGEALSAVISECFSLRELIIVCSMQNLRVVSQSLESVQILMSSADSLEIEYAPKLRVLATGIRPRDGGPPVLIAINGAHTLTEVYYWMLPYHSITIRSASAIKRRMCLASVQKLRLGVEMADPHQIAGLVQVLQRLPYLADLGVWRMDDVSPDEGSDEALGITLMALSSLQCVQFGLTHLVMEGFQRGRTEMAVLICVLEHATKLLEVRIEPKVMPEEQASLAAVELHCYLWASKQCQIVIQSPCE